MNYNNEIVFFLDIDGVVATYQQIYISNPKKWHPKHKCYKFDVKCVKVFNEIIDIINPLIVLSSDWKLHYTIEELNEIFEWNGVNTIVSDITPKLLIEKDFYSINDLEKYRANEINAYIKEHNITKFIIIDDLNMSEWFGDMFIHTPRIHEGIKQTGVKEKIIKLYNKIK